MYTARTSRVSIKRVSMTFESNYSQRKKVKRFTTVLHVFGGPANSVIDPRSKPPFNISSSFSNPVDILARGILVSSSLFPSIGCMPE